MGKWKEKLQAWGEKGSKSFLNLNKRQAKYVTWGAYLVIALVLLTMLNNSLPGSKPGSSDPSAVQIPQAQPETQLATTDIGLLEKEMESKLAQILGQIRGAGQVSVNISLVSGPTYEYATNVLANSKTTREEVNEGSRVIEENIEEGQLVLTRGQNSQETPVVIREQKPQVQGVLVVAEGAANPQVRLELGRAVETALGVSSYQVHVVPMER